MDEVVAWLGQSQTNAQWLCGNVSTLAEDGDRLDPRLEDQYPLVVVLYCQLKLVQCDANRGTNPQRNARRVRLTSAKQHGLRENERRNKTGTTQNR